MRFSSACNFAIASSLPWLAACGVQAREARPNVLLVCWDTVRADHLTPYGYSERPTTPFLDRLARESIVFDAASATAGWTKPSVPSFLTGRYPSEHGVYEGSARRRAGATTDVLPPSAVTLAEVFREAGYGTAAFVKNAQLRRGNGFEQGFDLYADEAGDARAIRWSALDWLAEREDDRPFFLYLHFLDAHWPYAVPDEYAARFADPRDVAPFRARDFRAVRDAIHDGERPFPASEREHLEALYDGSLRYLDDQLARLMEELERRGLAGNLIVCVVADHGEEFGEHGRIGHGHGLWRGLLHVPWILRVPGLAPARVSSPVSLVDLFPTLLGAAGLGAGRASSGVDRLREPDRVGPVIAEHKAPDRYLRSIRLGARKLIRDALPAPELLGGGFPVRVGERWEARLEGDGAELRVTRLQPGDPDDGDDPLEWKGPVREVTAEGFLIGPVSVGLGPGVRRQTVAGTDDRRLFEGRVVKVRGRMEDGRLVAERIKLYAPGDGAGLEVRGPVEAVGQDSGGARRLVLGGFTLRVDGATEVRADGAERLGREAVGDLLLGKTTHWTFTDRLYDLRRDPEELSPEQGMAAEDLRDLLSTWGRRHASRRLWGEGDRRDLDARAIEDLRAIGYAE